MHSSGMRALRRAGMSSCTHHFRNSDSPLAAYAQLLQTPGTMHPMYAWTGLPGFFGATCTGAVACSNLIHKSKSRICQQTSANLVDLAAIEAQVPAHPDVTHNLVIAQ